MAYRDETPITTDDVNKLMNVLSVGNIDTVAMQVATWMREKMYGDDVREALAQWTLFSAKISEYLINDEQAFKLDITRTKNDLLERQGQVEARQTDVENQFREVVANATKDSEIILARDSKKYGAFATVDDRMENIENLVAQYIPTGFTVTIKHNQHRQPKVRVRYYEYALGTEPDGIGTGPKGSFGGYHNVDVPVTVEYSDMDTCIVRLPLDYRMAGRPVFEVDKWRLIDGYKILSFELDGTIDTAQAVAGNNSNTTNYNVDDLTTPHNLQGTALNESTEKLDWE